MAMTQRIRIDDMEKVARTIEWETVCSAFIVPIPYAGNAGPILEQLLARRWWSERAGADK